MKPLVIAGNGPSLRGIDYTRLPAEFDVFRCNQFHFEDQYFLGKKVTGAFMCQRSMREQFFTLKELKRRGEYEVDAYYCFPAQYASGPPEGLEYHYPSIKNTFDHLKSLPDFHELAVFMEEYLQKIPTSGFRMIVSAIALGYREIYVAGLDLYGGGAQYRPGLDVYGFDARKPNMMAALPEMTANRGVPKHHSRDTDLAVLNFAMKVPGVQLKSVCLQTPLNEYVEMACVVNAKPMKVEQKTEGALVDFYFLPGAERILRLAKVLDFWRIAPEYRDLRLTYLRPLIFGTGKLVKQTCTIVRCLLMIGLKVLFVWVPRKGQRGRES
ncbi:MAG: alpha-2,3-sialyltransferase [Spirochaetia bacterium]